MDESRVTQNSGKSQAIPSELKEYDQWAVGGRDKAPIDAKTGRPASSTDPSTWSSFDIAWAYYLKNKKKCLGVGFMLSEDDPFTIVDLDKCIEADGSLNDKARETCSVLESYTEISQSNKGLHIVGRAVLKDGGRKRDGIEIYDRARFIIITGRQQNAWDTIEDIQAGVDVVLQKMGGKTLHGVDGWKDLALVVDSSRTPPQAKYEALREADNRFKLSCDRQRKDLKDSSPSAYDMSLASIALREKWTEQEVCDLLVYCRVKNGEDLKRKDYFKRTIYNARIKADQSQEQEACETHYVDPENALKAIRTLTNMRIAAIFQHGQKESTWSVQFDDGDTYTLGSTAAARTMATWQDMLLEKGDGGERFGVSKKNWAQFVRNIAAARTVLDRVDLSFTGRVLEMLRTYIESSGGLPVQHYSDDFSYCFLKSRPFFDEAGMLNVAITALHRFIIQNGMRAELEKVATALEELGFTGKRIARTVEGARKWRTYYSREWSQDEQVLQGCAA